MASVTSLDQDVRKLRLDRYTPAAVREAQRWIESVLQEDLPGRDLMESLRDGVVLCKLVNLIAQPQIKYKTSNMPFVQMENISHFLRACEMPPLSLPSHDRFLTVDLYDQKDPAQVLQCLAAFSRRANAIDPAAFPRTIGAKASKVAMSPSNTGSIGPKTANLSAYTVNTPPKPAYNFGSPTDTSTLDRGGLASSGPVSSWSSRSDEDRTAPAWNIHQYGYMGGANQGNQGVAFGGRRQIVSPQPDVPSLAEKEKRLRQKIEQEQRSSAHSEKTQAIQPHKQQNDRVRERTVSSASLNGQFLSQYQASQATQIQPQHSAEQQRIADLERQLADAKAEIAQRTQPQIATTRTAVSAPQRPELASTPSLTSIPPRPSAPTPNTAIEHDIENDYQTTRADITPDEPPPEPRPTFAEPVTNIHTNTTNTRSSPSTAGTTTRTNHMSLLEREMERERQRQREWEENQLLQGSMRVAAADVDPGSSVNTATPTPTATATATATARSEAGQNWNVRRDNQNRGDLGIGIGGRRQIIGPRPPPP